MRKIKDVGRRTALAGIGAALSVIFVTLAYFVKNLSLSFYVLSAVGVMLPLVYGYYREGILSSVVVGVAGFFIANLGVIPFVAVSGFYVVFSVFWHNKGLNRWLGYGIKIAYSCLVFFLLYKVTSLISIDFSALPTLENLSYGALYAILNVIFVLCFIVYDILLEQGYVYLSKTVKKILKNG